MVRLRREDPRVVGPYRLQRRLGTGGMGVVYLGSDRRGQKVALKLIRAELAEDQEFRTRFAREVAAAARIRGGCIARLVASDIDAERPWLATSYVPGPSLYKRVGDEGPLPWSEVAAIGAALADGLVHVHQAGVVHRDLKPSNILLSPKGPRIIDFGIAWSTGASTLTHVGTAVGSPGFLAPEQVRGIAVTGATDVFALGTTLAYAATGDSPFGSGSSEVMLYRVVHEEPDLGEVPGALTPILRACLAKEAVDRPTTIQLRDRLRELTARGAAIGRSQLPQPLARQSRPAQADQPQAARGPAARPPGRRPVMPPTLREPAPPMPTSTSAPTVVVRSPGQGHGSPAGSGQTAHGPSGHERTGHGPSGHERSGHGSSGHGSSGHGQAHGQGAAESAARPQVPRPAAREAATPVAARRTPPPGRQGRSPSRRLLRQRFFVFITVTLIVAVVIAVAQGCQGRSSRGSGPAAPAPSVRVSGAPGSSPGPQGTRSAGAVPGTDEVSSGPDGSPGAQPPAQGAASLVGADTAQTLTAAGSVPAVDWADRRFPDPSDGSMILLQDGRSLDGGSPVALTAVLPAQFRGAPAAVVVLTRQSGGAPEDLVELFGLGGAEPVLLASHASTGTPQSTSSWRIAGGAVLREEHTQASGGRPVGTTRYSPLDDGTMSESWPGSGTVADQSG
ncbi:serine/threonine-protein kinase [Streptacidiphilus sp. PB12-B1b]|uniref:serine/threonine-protein kinase n=1 Tax=Streptacidiphilus sp. PB12-B1b TaxID=2705012 RepID=UPI0015F8FE5A